MASEHQTQAARRPDDTRHLYGPRPLAALLPQVMRPALRKRAPATAMVLADWHLIVGPALAAVTQPRRLSAGTLSISCSGPVAMELQHLGDVVLQRINQHHGRPVVARLRFMQDLPPPPLPAALPDAPLPPETRSAADRAVADVAPGPLRDALASLGRAVLGHAMQGKTRC